MERKRYAIEFGMGTDLHGGDVTKAALKAIKDAMSHCCLAGVQEILGTGPQGLALKIKICCPRPKELDLEALKEPVHFYRDVEIVAEPGGATEKGLYVPAMGEGDNLTIAIAIITIYLNEK